MLSLEEGSGSTRLRDVFHASFTDAVTKTRLLRKSLPDNPVPWRGVLGHGSG